MKRKLFYLFVIFTIVNMTSCNPSEELDDPILTLAQNEYDIPSSGKTIVVELSTNIDFEVVMPEVDWIIEESSTKTTSNHIRYFVVSENLESDSRSAEIIFKSNDNLVSDAVTINQSYKEKDKGTIIVSPKTYSATSDGEVLDVTLKTNVDFEISFDCDWITQITTRSLDSYNLKFQIAASDETTERIGKIKIKDKNTDLFEEIVVTQKEKKIVENDKEYLIALYNATGGDNWKKKTNWNSEEPLEEWHGVTVDKTTGMVLKLNLRANNLTGSIPAEIGNLTDLEELDLSNNDIFGTIPAEIGSLTNLKVAILRINYLDVNDGDLPSEITSHPNYSDWKLTPQKTYESTDLAQDGKVLTLQTASVGNGIDIVIMGDGFIDKDMATDGKYEQRIKEAMEHFFSEEPYTSFRDRYNVYCVKAVSKNEGIGTGITTIFGSVIAPEPSTYIEGNNDKIFEYALKVTDITSLQNLTILTILNTPRYAGTCHMWYDNNSTISYCPVVGYDDERYRQIIAHEASGHGFAKLADEYAYTGTITADQKENYERRKTLDWAANIDITNDPATIRWAHMLSDPTYSDLVGVYEGGFTFKFGVWRSTETSIMVTNTGGFNAVSRESIYKTIMTLSGEGFTYDNFVEYDAVNRTAKAMARRRAQAEQVNMKTFVPLAPPVVYLETNVSK